MRGLCGEAFGLGGFFFKADDAPVLVGLNDTKLLCGFLGGNFNGGNGHVGAGIDMLLEHLGVVHLVDVVAG